MTLDVPHPDTGALARQGAQQTGGQFHLALQDSAADVGTALATCPRVRRIVDAVAQRKGLPRLSRDGVMLAEVWMRLQSFLPWRDLPENVYSLIWRVAEFAAMDLRREGAMKEIRECDMDEEQRDLVMGNHSDDWAWTHDAARGIDQHAARARFAAKVARLGWDGDADPRTYKGITAPGRKAA